MHPGDVTRSRLALRTEVAAAARDHDAADFRLAVSAGLAGALIDAQARQEIARAPFDVNVIPKARALKGHSILEHLPHRSIELARFTRRHSARLGEGMDARREERLVGVDVAEARQDPLVHQPALDGAPAAAQGMQELVEGDLLRIRPETRKDRLQLRARATPQTAEAARIAVPQFLSSSLQFQSQVGMRLERRSGGMGR